MKLVELLIYLLPIITIIHGSRTYCNLPKECQVIDLTQRQLPTSNKLIKCLLNDASQLRFNKSLIANETKSCQILDKDHITAIIIRPEEERSLILKKGMVDLRNFIDYLKTFKIFQLYVIFELFSGFEVNLFDDNLIPDNIGMSLFSMYNTFDFYSGNKMLKSCRDFQEATNNTKSIFQLFTNIYKEFVDIYLSESRNKICPLAFKNYQETVFQVGGENSFYSRKLLTFSSEIFHDLNSTIRNVKIFLNNVDLDFDFLHPSVFKNLTVMNIYKKVNKINPDLFLILNNVAQIFLPLEYLRSVIHTNGIEWIKNINKNISCDLENISQLNESILSDKVKYIFHDLEKRYWSSSLRDAFPDEDFCLYKDFPINQLVIFNTFWQSTQQPRTDLGCTYLWVTRSYKQLHQVFGNYTNFGFVILSVLNSNDYKSISKCNFDYRLKLCNK